MMVMSVVTREVASGVGKSWALVLMQQQLVRCRAAAALSGSWRLVDEAVGVWHDGTSLETVCETFDRRGPSCKCLYSVTGS